MKTISVRQFATVKRVAQNVNPLVVKKNKILSKIVDLKDECTALEAEIEGHEMGIKALTGGLTSEDLVVKRIEDTGKVDKDGKPIKKTVYEPSDKLVWDEAAGVYNIIEDTPIAIPVGSVEEPVELSEPDFE